MEIQIGSLIEHQDGLMKGIIVNHWTAPNPYTFYAAGRVDCIRLFMVYDHSQPRQLNETITFRDFRLHPYWRVINEL